MHIFLCTLFFNEYLVHLVSVVPLKCRNQLTKWLKYSVLRSFLENWVKADEFCWKCTNAHWSIWLNLIQNLFRLKNHFIWTVFISRIICNNWFVSENSLKAKKRPISKTYIVHTSVVQVHLKREVALVKKRFFRFVCEIKISFEITYSHYGITRHYHKLSNEWIQSTRYILLPA